MALPVRSNLQKLILQDCHKDSCWLLAKTQYQILDHGFPRISADLTDFQFSFSGFIRVIRLHP